jgi:calcineurin-like phosphoesterase family protein
MQGLSSNIVTALGKRRRTIDKFSTPAGHFFTVFRSLRFDCQNLLGEPYFFLRRMANFHDLPLYRAPVSISPVSAPQGAARILLVSDTHLCHFGLRPTTISSFLSELKTLVKHESVTHIFHLGDLVDARAGIAGPRVLKAIFDAMEKWKIPTWMLAGNHDRPFFEQLPRSRRKYVHVSIDDALLLTLPGPAPRKIFLAHYIGQLYHVRGKDVMPYLEWLKAGFQEVFTADDWLITGHCHTVTLSPDSRVGCVGQFSPEAGARAYGVLSIGDDIYFEVQDDRGGFGTLL